MILKKRRLEIMYMVVNGMIRSTDDFTEHGIKDNEYIFTERLIREDNSFQEGLENACRSILKNNDKFCPIHEDTEIEFLAYDIDDIAELRAYSTIHNIEKTLESEESKVDTSLVYDVFLTKIAHIELDEYIRIGEFSSDNGFEFIDTLEN